MKGGNNNWIWIVLGIVVLVGVVYYFNLGSKSVNDDVLLSAQGGGEIKTTS